MIEAVEEGLSAREAARQFKVGISTAIKWHRRYRETGEAGPRKQGQPSRSRLNQHEVFILDLIADQPDITLTEIAERLAEGHDVHVVPSTIRYFLDKRGVILRKGTAPAAEQQRPDVLKRREAWFEAQPALDPEKLIFIDETGASTKMAQLHGHSHRGERCHAAVPHGHWKPLPSPPACG